MKYLRPMFAGVLAVFIYSIFGVSFPGSTSTSQIAAAQAPSPTPVPPTPAPPAGVVARIVRIDPSQATLGQPIVVDLEVSGANFPHCNQTFRTPVQVMLVMDASSSMGSSGLVEPAHQAAIAFVGLLDTQQDEVGLMKFSGSSQLLQAPTRNFDTVRSQISNVGAEDGTNTADAINEASRQLLSAQSSGTTMQPVILLLTDGKPNDVDSAIRAAKDVTDKGVLLLAINAGDQSGEAVLKQMVQNPATDYFFAPSAADLSGAFKQAFKTFDRLALSGVNVVVTQQIAQGFTADPASLEPPDGKIEGNAIVWHRDKLRRSDIISFSYRVLPGAGAVPNLSSGQMIGYEDCNKQIQQIDSPPNARSNVSVTDPASLPFPTVARTQSFVSSESRPNPWIWVGIWVAIIVALLGVIWLRSRGR